MSIRVFDFQPLRELQTERNEAQNCVSINLSNMVQWAEWSIAKLRSGIQLNPNDLPPRLHAILGSVFPHYQANASITPLGALQNLLNQEEAPHRNAIILALRAVNDSIHGFSGKVFNQFEAENENRAVEANIPALRMAVEHTLLLGFRQLDAEQQGGVHGAVYANADHGLRNEAFYGENHLLDNWDNFTMVIPEDVIRFDAVEAEAVVVVGEAPIVLVVQDLDDVEDPVVQNVGGVMADIAANHQDVRAWSEWDLVKIRNGEVLGATDNEHINAVHALDFNGYVPNIDNTVALGALQEVLYDVASTQQNITDAIDLMNATFPEFSSAVRKQFNEETHLAEEQYVHQKANVRKAIEHVLLRFVNLQSQQRKDELYLNLPDLLHSWAAFQTAWGASAPNINPLDLNKNLHGRNGGHFGDRMALNFADGVDGYTHMQRQSPQMRVYYWPEGQQGQVISGRARDSLLISLPADRRHLLPLSVQEQIEGLTDAEILLDMHMIDSTDQVGILHSPRTQFMMHGVMMRDNRLQGHRQADIDTNALNPLRVGLFETRGMNEEQNDAIKFNELRQENQIIHGTNFGYGVLSPANMQTQFQTDDTHEADASFYFVGRWRDAVGGKKAVVSYYDVTPDMDALKGAHASIAAIPGGNALKDDTNPRHADFRRLLSL